MADRATLNPLAALLGMWRDLRAFLALLADPPFEDHVRERDGKP